MIWLQYSFSGIIYLFIFQSPGSAKSISDGICSVFFFSKSGTNKETRKTCHNEQVSYVRVDEGSEVNWINCLCNMYNKIYQYMCTLFSHMDDDSSDCYYGDLNVLLHCFRYENFYV